MPNKVKIVNFCNLAIGTVQNDGQKAIRPNIL